MSESQDKICGVIKNRINTKNKSYSMLFVGEMGSGKSYGALSCACKIDPSFIDNPRLVFNVHDFLEQLTTIEKGQVLIFDEAGVGVPAREWHSQLNKAMSIVSQILRFKQVCIIFTTPNMRFIDINVRAMLNAVVKMKAIDFNNSVAYSKYNVIKIDDAGNVRYTDFVFYESAEYREKIDPFLLPQPPEKIKRWYDDVSVQFKNKTIRELLQITEQDKNGGVVNPAEVTKLQNQSMVCLKLLEYMKDSHTWDELQKLTGMSGKQLKRWIDERTQTQ